MFINKKNRSKFELFKSQFELFKLKNDNYKKTSYQLGVFFYNYFN